MLSIAQFIKKLLICKCRQKRSGNVNKYIHKLLHIKYIQYIMFKEYIAYIAYTN